MRIIVLLCAIALLAIGAYLSFMDKVAAAATTYAAGVLCLVFTFLQEFKSFKGFGVEAELLERKIAEADTALRQLREITTPITELLITIAARSGGAKGPISRKNRQELLENIESELAKCGVTKEQLHKAKNDWHHCNKLDLAQPILNSLSSRVEYFMGRELQKISGSEHTSPGIELADIYRNKLNSIKFHSNPDEFPRLIREFIENATFMDEAEKSSLRAEIDVSQLHLQHYIDQNDFLDKEKWYDDEKKDDFGRRRR